MGCGTSQLLNDVQQPKEKVRNQNKILPLCRGTLYFETQSNAIKTRMRPYMPCVVAYRGSRPV